MLIAERVPDYDYHMEDDLAELAGSFVQNVLPWILLVVAVIAVIYFIRRTIFNTKRITKTIRMSKNDLDYHSREEMPSSDASGDYRTVRGFLVKLDTEAQGKFIPGRNGYETARNSGNIRSVVFRDAAGLQKLLDEKAGTGDFVATNKEKVNFGQVIGQYMDPETKSKMETTVGVIHYTAEGAYIAPARPSTRRLADG